MKYLMLFILSLLSFSVSAQQLAAPMMDTDGRQINCHGGGLMCVGDTWFWYGEHRAGLGDNYQRGVTCYSSKDLVSWTNHGVVFEVADDTVSLVQRGCTIERPKVVFCLTTGKYVMWMHLELKGRGYAAAFAAVAISDLPTGPFRLLHAGRVNRGRLPIGMDGEPPQYTGDSWTDEWRKAVENGLYVWRDMDGGQMSRDMTLYVDDDGRAYHIYSSEENLTLHIAELTDDYTSHTGRYVRVMPCGHNEAPTLVKHDGVYWMIASGCTGWAPNKARMMRADHILGPWQMVPGTPCEGEGADTTFGAQGTFIVTLSDGAHIFMADQWTPKCLGDSRNLWLPLTFNENNQPVIRNTTR